MTSGIAKAGIGYTVANVLIRGISFLTLPVFSRVLDTYDFGVYNVFIAYDAILYVVVGLALHSSVKSANWEYPGKIDEYVSSISLIYIFNMAALLMVALAFGPQLSSVLGLDGVVLICLVIHSVGSALVTLYNNRISLQYSYGKYMAVAAASSLGNVALSLVLVFTVFYGQRYLGRIAGATIAFALVGLFVLGTFWSKARPRANLAWWRFGTRYSIPIVFHGLSQVALAQIGRLMINYMVSTTAAGVYGLAANLQIVMTTLTDSISTVWSTWFYETMEESKPVGEAAKKGHRDKAVPSREAAIQHRAGQLAMLFVFPTVALLAISPEMIWILGGDAYIEGAYCAFGMILSGYCIFVYNIVVVGEYYKQKTGYIMWATIGAAIVNAALTYVCIRQFGYLAAAYATLAAYMLYAAVHWVISKRLMGFEVIRLSTLVGAAATLTASLLVSVTMFDNVAVRVGANIALCLPLLVSFVRRSGGLSGLKSMAGR